MKLLLLLLLLVLATLLTPSNGQTVANIKIGLIAHAYNTSFVNSIKAAFNYMSQLSFAATPGKTDFERNETVISFRPTATYELKFELVDDASLSNATLSGIRSAAMLDAGAHGIIGDTYSAGAITTSTVAALRKKPVISFAATSAVLSNKAEHPTFFRTVPSDSLQAKFLVDFCFFYGWYDLATLASAETYGLRGVESVVASAQQSGITVQTQQTFPAGDAAAIDTAVSNLKNSGKKTIIVFASNTNQAIARIVLAAQKYDMLSSGYTWIFSEAFANIVTITNNAYTLTSNAQTIAGLTNINLLNGILFVRIGSSLFTKDTYLTQQMASSPTRSSFDPFAYDAAMAYGLAFRDMLTRGENINDGTLVTAALRRVNFIGASGRNRFDQFQDRIGTVYSMLGTNNAVLSQVSTWSAESGLSMLLTSLTLPGAYTYTVEPRDTSSTVGANQWRSILSSFPTRHSHAFAYNRKSDELVVFGGTDNRIVHADAWSYSLKNELWTKNVFMSLDFPSKRYGSAYFSIDDSLVIYGGSDSDVILNDMWEYKFVTKEWKKRAPALTPGARFQGRMSQFGRTAFLFGGYVNDGRFCSNELWQYNYDTNSWKMITPATSAAPSPRFSHCQAVIGSYLVVVAGSGCGADISRTGLNDVWIFDINRNYWVQVNQTNPLLVRYDLRCDSIDNDMYVSGGWNDALKYNPNDILKLSFNFATLFPNSSVFYNSTTMTWTTLISSIPDHIARDSAPALAFQNFFIWCGGWGETGIQNDMFMYNVRTNATLKLHSSYDSKSSASNAANALVGNQIFLFSGRADDQTLDTTMRRYVVDQKVWQTVQPSGEIPAPRVSAQFINIGDSLYMFGGKGANELYLNDMWAYSINLTQWTRIPTPTIGDVPSPRAGYGAAVFSNSSAFVIYGGRDTNTHLDELWSYNVELNYWTKIEYSKDSGSSPAPTCIDLSCVLRNDDSLVCGAGVDTSEYTGPIINEFKFSTSVWSVFSTIPGATLPRSRVGMSYLGSDSLLVLAGNYYDDLSGDLMLVQPSLVRKVDVSTSLVFPQGRQAPIAHMFGSKLITLSGIGSMSNLNLRSARAPLNDIWEFSLGPVCSNETTKSQLFYDLCINCTAGTYEFKGKCLMCPSGTYTAMPGSTSCLPCPLGFFSNIPGANTKKLCFPCPFGTYSNVTGASACIPCPAKFSCPIGSVQPSALETTKVEAASLDQPIPYAGFSDIAAPALYGGLSAAAFLGFVVMVVLLLIALCSSRCYSLYRYADILYSARHNRDEGVMYKRRTPIGGIFTIIAIFFILGMLAALLAPAIGDNEVETRSLIPNLAVARSKLPLSAAIDAFLTLEGYSGSCAQDDSIATFQNCSQFISYSASTFNASDTSLSCLGNNVKNAHSGVCVIRFRCARCSFKSDTAAVSIQVQDPLTFASSYIANITTATGYPVQYTKRDSRVTFRIKSDEKKFFRGTAVETQLNLLAIQTTFDWLGYADTGFHLDFRGSTLGEQVGFREFNTRNGIKFGFNFLREANTLEVIRSQKKSPVSVISEILGSLSGLIAAIGFVMGIVEWILEDYVFVLLKLNDRLAYEDERALEMKEIKAAPELVKEEVKADQPKAQV